MEGKKVYTSYLETEEAVFIAWKRGCISCDSHVTARGGWRR